jgi:hypothetical protein
VDADDGHRGLERRIGDHVVRHLPADAVVADDLDARESLGVEGAAEVLVPRLVVALLVPPPEVGDLETVGLGAAEPADDVVDRVLSPVVAAADPARRRPGEADQLELRIACPGLLGQPELVADAAVHHSLDVLDAGLGAVRGVRVATDLDLQELEAGAEVRLEQVVQYLGTHGLGIVDEETAIASAAADGADTVEHAPGRGAAHVDVRVRRHHRLDRGQAEQGGQQAGAREVIERVHAVPPRFGSMSLARKVGPRQDPGK